MLAGAEAGEVVAGGSGPFGVAEMRAWPSGRSVRASVLRHLLVDEQWRVDPRGVRLRGVRISGPLDCQAATLRCPLSLDGCYLDADEPVCFDHATALVLALVECHLGGLSGELLARAPSTWHVRRCQAHCCCVALTSPATSVAGAVMWRGATSTAMLLARTG
jgi:hypothetical protein